MMTDNEPPNLGTIEKTASGDPEAVLKGSLIGVQ